MGMTVPEVSRRGFLGGFGALALGGAAGLLVEPEPVEADGTSWWGSLSQARRNQEITNRAWQQNGQYFSPPAGECKEWARAVVRYASLSHVNLPSTNSAPNDWYWQNDPSGHTVGQCIYIAYTVPGQIVQMRYKSTGTPHTTIVVANDGSGVKFLASNDPLGSYTVRERYWKYADFHAAMSAYAVYTIR